MVEPMLATAATEVPVGPEWSYEPKWDGYRAIAKKTKTRVRISSRNLKDLTGQYPSIAAAINRLTPKALILDGEIVALDAHGLPSFQALQHPGTTKNTDGRVFPVTRELRSLLEDRLRETRKVERQKGKILRHVFHRANGNRICGFRKPWSAACAAAGCLGRVPHDLRRSAVRDFVRRGIPERVAMQLTGHRTRSVFERYNIVSDSDLRAAAVKLDAMGTIPGTTTGAATSSGK